ncbi:MAG: endonuclease MutS2, partial [Deltaproteobacteria bacterium]
MKPPPSDRTQNLSTKTLTTLEWPRIMAQLVQFADSPMGKERCRELTFHTSLTAVREVQAETSEMRGLLDGEDPIPFAPFADLREALAMARIGAILPGETLVEIRRLLGMSAKVSRFLAAHREDAPHLAAIGKRLTSLRDLWKRLCVTLSERGEVLDHASPALKSYRREAQALHHRIKRRLEQIVATADYLQEDYYTLRADRYVLPVKVEMRNRVEGIVHDTSGSGQTIYIEPAELVELNNEVRLADLKVEEEIRRILGELTALVAEKIEAISENLVVLAHLDFIHARARLSQALEGIEPIVTERPVIDLRQAANPVLLLTKRREEVVANDIALHGKALILSGPNTGGKTVTLKTVGLCALMLRAGLHIPAAAGSRLGVFPDIFADIGDEQSISGSLSTFSGHIYTLVEILGKVKAGSLVLLDEIAVGTDPIQGTALARALLEHFVAKGTRVIVTTHYEGLKTLGSLHPDYENASVTFDLERMQPTYRVILGQPGKSYALEIAEKLGIPPAIIARAHEFLGAETRDMERVLSSLEARENEYLRRNREIATLRAELLELKEGYRRRLDQLETKRRDFQTRIRRELDRELDRVKREMNRLLKEAQNEARGDQKRIIRLKKRAGRLARSVVPPLD